MSSALVRQIDRRRLTVSAIMPTKDRPAFLEVAVRALLAQTVPIDELIVVDQSRDDTGRRRVRALIAALPVGRRPRLDYVLDPSINGDAGPRNVGMDRANGDILLCCDDDVVADLRVVANLLTHYAVAPECAGLAPVITNYDLPGRLHRVHRWLFCRGPFHDERQPVYWHWRRYTGPTRVPVRMFTGAMMSFRRAVLDDLRHDPRYRDASIGEDIDLCWSLGRRGARLAIATDARIVHNRAPRPSVRPEQAQIAAWGFLYEKHLPKTLATRAALAWYITGIFVSASLCTIRGRNLAPLRSALAGLRALRSDHTHSSFLAPTEHSSARTS
ncbi:MAG TPA: glycosyltransferase [Methylomirabilota bacterium]|jgi:GT2 family glycosyltransferase|nr:glycosyltransferase [Methylomirabilota bacterium]